jgi:hypothetical protein
MVGMRAGIECEAECFRRYHFSDGADKVTVRGELTTRIRRGEFLDSRINRCDGSW